VQGGGAAVESDAMFGAGVLGKILFKLRDIRTEAKGAVVERAGDGGIQVFADAANLRGQVEVRNCRNFFSLHGCFQVDGAEDKRRHSGKQHNRFLAAGGVFGMPDEYCTRQRFGSALQERRWNRNRFEMADRRGATGGSPSPDFPSATLSSSPATGTSRCRNPHRDTVPASPSIPRLSGGPAFWRGPERWEVSPRSDD